MGPTHLVGQTGSQPVDGGTKPDEVVDNGIRRKTGTAPDGGHRGPSTHQAPGGRNRRASSLNPEGEWASLIVGYLGP